MFSENSRNGRSLIADAVAVQHLYEEQSAIEQRKRKGQFFTPAEVCKYMAGLLTHGNSKSFRLLDPGAGAGVLTAAVCEKLLDSGSSREIDLHVFENDRDVLPFLERNLIRCCDALRSAGHAARFVIHEKDFILDAASTVFGERSLFDRADYGRFDAAIMNPPYFKIGKDSEHARVMRDVVHGQPNIYAFFMAAAAMMLRDGGELAAITPRSFCSGLYFRGFRRWFLERASLQHIHLFESRTDTFRDVLQESIVTHWKKSAVQSPRIAVSTSFGRDAMEINERQSLPSDRVIEAMSGDSVIRIPGSAEDTAVVEFVESWPRRFSDHGLRVSTGPVVAYRAREFLLNEPGGTDSVPLISVFNVKPFETVWPLQHRKHPMAFRRCADSQKLLLPARNYVLLRRFSAKEERRRLTASCFVAADSVAPFIALENHLNYVYHHSRELTDDEILGLAALFNSVLLDNYFRTISGNTQVNASELRSMPFPPLRTLSRIGQSIGCLKVRTNPAVETIVHGELGINGSLGRRLLDVAS